MNEKWDKIQGKFDLVRVSGEFELSDSRYRGSSLHEKIKVKKKNCEVNRADIFCRRIRAEGSVTFQNIFLSVADFCDVVSVLPCSPTNRGK